MKFRKSLIIPAFFLMFGLASCDIAHIAEKPVPEDNIVIPSDDDFSTRVPQKSAVYFYTSEGSKKITVMDGTHIKISDYVSDKYISGWYKDQDRTIPAEDELVIEGNTFLYASYKLSITPDDSDYDSFSQDEIITYNKTAFKNFFEPILNECYAESLLSYKVELVNGNDKLLVYTIKNNETAEIKTYLDSIYLYNIKKETLLVYNKETKQYEEPNENNVTYDWGTEVIQQIQNYVLKSNILSFYNDIVANGNFYSDFSISDTEVNLKYVGRTEAVKITYDKENKILYFSDETLKLKVLSLTYNFAVVEDETVPEENPETNDNTEEVTEDTEVTETNE